MLLHGNQVALPDIEHRGTASLKPVARFGDPNADPPQTVQLLSPDGLLTAVPPFACTWENLQSRRPPLPSFAIVGCYTVTATYQGMTTPPAFLPVRF